MVSLKRRLAGRSGLTLVEVLMALAIFLIGSVSIIGLFVTASMLHKDAVERRTASYIAEDLLAELKGTPFREVFAKTNLDGQVLPGVANLDVDSTEADFNFQGAAFNLWPISIAPGQDRNAGPVLIDREWMWYEDIPTDDTLDVGTNRGLWGTDDETHADRARVLAPRTWVYVLNDSLDSVEGDPTDVDIEVMGNPGGDAANPPEVEAPASGYIVVDTEWIRYTSRNWDATNELGTFAWDDPAEDRGAGDTAAPAHSPGTPVTVAREHPYHPGFYYTVQFYPVNASGAESKVFVSVGYGTARRLRRAHFFHTVYTPSKF